MKKNAIKEIITRTLNSNNNNNNNEYQQGISKDITVNPNIKQNLHKNIFVVFSVTLWRDMPCVMKQSMLGLKLSQM